jgi:hypothetical protein
MCGKEVRELRRAAVSPSFDDPECRALESLERSGDATHLRALERKRCTEGDDENDSDAAEELWAYGPAGTNGV